MSSPAVTMSRWLSGELVGDAQHVLVVRIRPGYMDHGYFNTTRIDVPSPIFPPLIWKGQNHSCWKGKWTPTGAWVTLPNVQSAHWVRSFQDKGLSSLTVVMDNVNFADTTGASGLYHVIQRGWFSPMRGVTVASRPAVWASNAWDDVLNGGYQIELWEGYGDPTDPTCIPLASPVSNSCAPASAAISRTWTGIIEDCEMESHPDHITITARDFGVLFTDQRVMGWNKAREIQAPVTFADRNITQGESKITGPYDISSGRVTGSGVWTSGGSPAFPDVEYIGVDLPAGYYEDFFFSPRYAGENMWVSLFLGAGGGVQDSVHPFPAGWVDLGGGLVTPDGTPAMRYWGNVPAQSRRWYLGHGWDVPAGSQLYLTFSNLQPDATLGTGTYAGSHAYWAYRFGSNPANPPSGGPGVNAHHWILTRDATDVLRMVFIWCGFQEWHIDNFGWGLVNPKIYGEASFFMDVIEDMLAQGNFVFYMDGPTDDDRSIGVPHFEYQTATDPPPGGMLQVRDVSLLEAATATWDMSELPFVMRYRGDVDPSQTGALVQRFKAIYYPPWTGVGWDTPGLQPNQGTQRVAGVRRHFTETLGATTTVGLQSDSDCLFACVLAAVQYALGECTGGIQCPGIDAFNLNTQTSIIDEGSGLNSRMWVASIESTHNLGPNGSWHMSVGGSYLDTKDMALIARDYADAYQLMLQGRAQPIGG